MKNKKIKVKPLTKKKIPSMHNYLFINNKDKKYSSFF